MPPASHAPAPFATASGPLPRSRATVAMGFVTGMLHGMLQRGKDPAPLLAAAGIDLADPASRIPVDRYAHLYNLVVLELDDEGFGLFSRAIAPGAFEFLCRGMLGATTLAEALQRACRFLRVVLPELSAEVIRHGEHAELRIIELQLPASGHDDPGRVFALEWLLRLLHAVASWFVGRGIAFDRVSFPYPRPAHAADYALVYTAHSRFDADCLSARFQANLLDLPIRRDESALGRFLQGAPGKIAMLYRRDREMVFRVRDLIRDALPDNLSLDTVATRLHLSPRTLSRRLEEEGSSFRAIKDATRRDIAYARLTKTRQPIAAIAADLGYAEPSAFYRAFIAWSGLSPERYRGQLARAAESAGSAGPAG